MNFVRYHKKCESWIACGAKGDKGAINFDYGYCPKVSKAVFELNPNI